MEKLKHFSRKHQYVYFLKICLVCWYLTCFMLLRGQTVAVVDVQLAASEMILGSVGMVSQRA